MPDRLVARRGNAGMKLFHVSDDLGDDSGRMHHAYVHDAYHPKPAKLGEGRPNSGIVISFNQREATTHMIRVHAIALDTFGRIAGWHLHHDNEKTTLEAPDADKQWSVQPSADRIVVREHRSGQGYAASDRGDDTWVLTHG